MTRQNINVACDLKASAGRTFTGYGSVFDIVDSYRDRILRGAFAQSLQARRPKLLWQHKFDHPIGKWTTVREDVRGLYVAGELADTTLGREVHTLLKMGALDGLSIGFNIIDSTPNTYGGRDISALQLHEISIVTFPANEAALVEAIKARHDDDDLGIVIDRVTTLLDLQNAQIAHSLQQMRGRLDAYAPAPSEADGVAAAVLTREGAARVAQHAQPGAPSWV